MNPDLEPKDGDFVAYIERIEKQQLAQLHGHRGPAAASHSASSKAKSLADDQDGFARSSREQARRIAIAQSQINVDALKSALPAIVLGGILTLAGLIMSDALILVLIGLFIAFQGLRGAFRALGASDATTTKGSGRKA